MAPAHWSSTLWHCHCPASVGSTVHSPAALQGQRVPHTTTNVSGIRDYAPGTRLTGSLEEHRAPAPADGQEFELDPFADIWLVLDMDERIMAGTGVSRSKEYAVTISATLSKFFLDENRAVGLVAPGLLLSPDRGTRQLLRIPEVLAFVRP